MGFLKPKEKKTVDMEDKRGKKMLKMHEKSVRGSLEEGTSATNRGLMNEQADQRKDERARKQAQYSQPQSKL